MGITASLKRVAGEEREQLQSIFPPRGGGGLHCFSRPGWKHVSQSFSIPTLAHTHTHRRGWGRAIHVGDKCDKDRLIVCARPVCRLRRRGNILNGVREGRPRREKKGNQRKRQLSPGRDLTRVFRFRFGFSLQLLGGQQFNPLLRCLGSKLPLLLSYFRVARAPSKPIALSRLPGAALGLPVRRVRGNL